MGLTRVTLQNNQSATLNLENSLPSLARNLRSFSDDAVQNIENSIHSRPLISGAVLGLSAGLLTGSAAVFRGQPMSTELLRALVQELGHFVASTFQQCRTNSGLTFSTALEHNLKNSSYFEYFQNYFRSNQGRQLLSLCDQALLSNWNVQQLNESFVRSQYHALDVHELSVNNLYQRFMGNEDRSGSNFARLILTAYSENSHAESLRNYIETQSVISGSLDTLNLSSIVSGWSGRLLSTLFIRMIARSAPTPLLAIGSALLCGAASSVGQVCFQAYWSTRNMSASDRINALHGMEWNFKSAVITGMFCGASELFGVRLLDKVFPNSSNLIHRVSSTFINFAIFNVGAELLSDAFLNRIGIAAAYVNPEQQDVLASQTLSGQWFTGAIQEVVGEHTTNAPSQLLNISMAGVLGTQVTSASVDARVLALDDLEQQINERREKIRPVMKQVFEFLNTIPNARVQCRLKETQSVIDKIARHSIVNLDALVDLAGTRIIVQRPEQVEDVYWKLMSKYGGQIQDHVNYDGSFDIHIPDSEPENGEPYEWNQIAVHNIRFHNRESGYRALHVVVELEHEGALFPVEIQVLTEWQNAWKHIEDEAYKCSLKLNEKIVALRKAYFKSVSDYLHSLENKNSELAPFPDASELKDEISLLDDDAQCVHLALQIQKMETVVRRAEEKLTSVLQESSSIISPRATLPFGLQVASTDMSYSEPPRLRETLPFGVEVPKTAIAQIPSAVPKMVISLVMGLACFCFSRTGYTAIQQSLTSTEGILPWLVPVAIGFGFKPFKILLNKVSQLLADASHVASIVQFNPHLRQSTQRRDSVKAFVDEALRDFEEHPLSTHLGSYDDSFRAILEKAEQTDVYSGVIAKVYNLFTERFIARLVRAGVSIRKMSLEDYLRTRPEGDFLRQEVTLSASAQNLEIYVVGSDFKNIIRMNTQESFILHAIELLFGRIPGFNAGIPILPGEYVEGHLVSGTFFGFPANKVFSFTEMFSGLRARKWPLQFSRRRSYAHSFNLEPDVALLHDCLHLFSLQKYKSAEYETSSYQCYLIAIEELLKAFDDCSIKSLRELTYEDENSFPSSVEELASELYEAVPPKANPERIFQFLNTIQFILQRNGVSIEVLLSQFYSRLQRLSQLSNSQQEKDYWHQFINDFVNKFTAIKRTSNFLLPPATSDTAVMRQKIKFPPASKTPEFVDNIEISNNAFYHNFYLDEVSKDQLVNLFEAIEKYSLKNNREQCENIKKQIEDYFVLRSEGKKNKNISENIDIFILSALQSDILNFKKIDVFKPNGEFGVIRKIDWSSLELNTRNLEKFWIYYNAKLNDLIQFEERLNRLEGNIPVQDIQCLLVNLDMQLNALLFEGRNSEVVSLVFELVVKIKEDIAQFENLNEMGKSDIELNLRLMELCKIQESSYSVLLNLELIRRLYEEEGTRFEDVLAPKRKRKRS